MNPDESSEPRFQFGLRTLLAAVTAVAVTIGLVSWLGMFGFVIDLVVVLAAVAWWEKGHQPTNERVAGLVKVVGLGLVFLIFAWLAIPGRDYHRQAARRMQCANNLKQIGLALHNYHSSYGTFPPAYIADAQGRPMHSWRVLILPFLEQKPLYDLYDFSEPWDGPNNRQVTAQVPDIFVCPAQIKAAGPATSATNYVAVIGPQTMWPGAQAVANKEISDGTTATLMVVEVRDSGIHWAEPRDLHVAQMATTINSKQGQGICSHHRDGANVAFADGSVLFLGDNIDPTTLQALRTRTGGEKIPSGYNE